MHPRQDLFLESFSYELQLDMHSYLHKNFILAKSGCYSVRRVEVTGLTIYHPAVASDGGICISQLSTKSLDLVLSGQQTSAQLHCHILVVYHLHPGDIPFHPIGLELILLPVG
jgi:hypothetical protein